MCVCAEWSVHCVASASSSFPLNSLVYLFILFPLYLSNNLPHPLCLNGLMCSVYITVNVSYCRSKDLYIIVDDYGLMFAWIIIIHMCRHPSIFINAFRSSLAVIVLTTDYIWFIFFNTINCIRYRLPFSPHHHNQLYSHSKLTTITLIFFLLMSISHENVTFPLFYRSND